MNATALCLAILVVPFSRSIAAGLKPYTVAVKNGDLMAARRTNRRRLLTT